MAHNDLLVCVLNSRLGGPLCALFLGKTHAQLTHLWVVINATDHEIHHAVLSKTIAFTVSAAVHIGVGVSGLSVY